MAMAARTRPQQALYHVPSHALAGCPSMHLLLFLLLWDCRAASKKHWMSHMTDGGERCKRSSAEWSGRYLYVCSIHATYLETGFRPGHSRGSTVSVAADQPLGEHRGLFALGPGVTATLLLPTRTVAQHIKTVQQGLRCPLSIRMLAHLLHASF